ncbi:MAG: acyl-CoA thioesterase [Gemmatimonadaceae bacterium]|nr:acyl-CoA thioesterase [Gemmatimonadaceae bacterium]
MPSPQPFLVSDRVRWADVDFVRIMRFSAFTRLIEVAEQELMRAAGLPYTTIFDAPAIYLPRRQLSIEYFAPARLDDELSLVTFVSRVGESSLTFNVDVWASAHGTLIASASMVVVCVAVETFAKQRLPDAIRDAVAPWVCSTEAARAWMRPAV